MMSKRGGSKSLKRNAFDEIQNNVETQDTQRRRLMSRYVQSMCSKSSEVDGDGILLVFSELRKIRENEREEKTKSEWKLSTGQDKQRATRVRM